MTEGTTDHDQVEWLRDSAVSPCPEWRDGVPHGNNDLLGNRTHVSDVLWSFRPIFMDPQLRAERPEGVEGLLELGSWQLEIYLQQS
ncbi:hypothetical protein OHS18_42070 [Amycolatopsis sp. NBC_00355]|uniref:hypothetical protein n=1 Tax=Amycolatopsis sp. NBC_00355 TaxID=2975957 RepID=UPI002E26F4E8